jgi:outer membrane protein assembly factor BamB
MMACLCLLLSGAAGAAAEEDLAQAAPGRQRLVPPAFPETDAELSAAERLLQKGLYEQALPRLQALLDAHPRRLVRAGPGWTTLADRVNAMLASLPAETRRAYSILYDPQAERLYRQGVAERSLPLLRQAAERHLNTAHGPSAAAAAAAILMDEGDFGAALLMLRRTDVLPLDADLAAGTAARKLLCLARLGRRSDAEELVAALEAEGIGPLHLGGAARPARELMDRAFAESVPRGVAPGPSWAPPGADTEPNRLFPLSAEVPWLGRVAPLPHSFPALYPAADGQQLYVSRDGTVLAFDRRTLGVEWTAPPPGRAADLMLGILEGQLSDVDPLPNFVGLGNPHRFRVFGNHGLAKLTVSDGRVYAVQFDPLAIRIPPQPWNAAPGELRITNELRCYDAATGALLWRSGGAGAASRLDDCWFYSAPAVQKGRAYALAARQGRLYALCLDARTGGLLWRSPVGAVESRQEVQRYLMEFFLTDAGPPAVRDGVIVFPTGQGLVAAFEAADGRPLWLTPYPRAEAWMGVLGQPINVPAGSWLAREPLPADGLCVVAPADSREVLALDAYSGKIRWHTEVPSGVALLSAGEGRVIVQDAGVTCLELATGRRLWQAPPRAPSAGLGAVRGALVLVPQPDGIRRIETESGRELDLLRWPPGSEPAGNLLLLEDVFLLAAPDRVTACRSPAEAIGQAQSAAVARPGDPLPALWGAVLSAWAGEREAALAGFEHAATMAGDRMGLAEQATVRRQTALSLADLAVRMDAPDLLEQARQAAGAAPEALPAVAVARLALVLSHAPERGTAGAYLALCREGAMTEAATPLGSASLWTVLAESVRSKCAGPSNWRAEWDDGFTLDTDAAVARGDAEGLIQIARWSPFPEPAEGALLAAARVLERDAKPQSAARAYAQVGGAATSGAREAAESLKRLLALLPEGPDYAASAPAEGPQVRLAQIPTAKAAWTVPGLLVPPATDLPPSLAGRVLVLDGRNLTAISADTGAREWSASLPTVAVEDSSRRLRSPAKPPPFGKGFPLWCPVSPRALVAAPTGTYGVSLLDGQVLWHRDGEPTRGWPLVQPPSRRDLAERVRRGLSVPSDEALSRIGQVDDFACRPLIACRLESDGQAAILDPFDGREFAEEGAPVRGSAIAFTAGRLCVAEGSPLGLSLFDTFDGSEVARWRLGGESFLLSLAAGGGCAAFSDGDRVYLFDAERARPAGWTPVPGGVERILHVDGSLLVCRSLEGQTVLVRREGAGRPLEATLTPSGVPLWAERQGDALYLLEAARLEGTAAYGPSEHWVGTGLVLRALDARDGREMWHAALPGPEKQMVGPPLNCGGLWLVGSGAWEKACVTGIEKDSGHCAFAVELDGPPGLRPVPMTVSEGRVVLGVGDRVTALAAAAGP